MRGARGGPSLAGLRKAGWRITVGKRRRRRRDRADGLRAPCFASPLPPEIPRPAPRGVQRAAVGRSSDSWARRASLLPTSAASQGKAPVLVAGSFPITAAGQCRSGANASPASRFNPVACDHRNRRAQHSGASRKRQHEMLCGTAAVGAMRVSRFGSFSPLGGEKVPEEPAPYLIRGPCRRAPGTASSLGRVSTYTSSLFLAPNARRYGAGGYPLMTRPRT